MRVPSRISYPPLTRLVILPKWPTRPDGWWPTADRGVPRRASDLAKGAGVRNLPAPGTCRCVGSAAVTAAPIPQWPRRERTGRRPGLGSLRTFASAKFRSDMTTSWLLRNRVRRCGGPAYRAGTGGLKCARLPGQYDARQAEVSFRHGGKDGGLARQSKYRLCRTTPAA